MTEGEWKNKALEFVSEIKSDPGWSFEPNKIGILFHIKEGDVNIVSVCWESANAYLKSKMSCGKNEFNGYSLRVYYNDLHSVWMYPGWRDVCSDKIMFMDILSGWLRHPPECVPLRLALEKMP